MEQILISGFGGQGVMSLGKFLARAAISENKFATWFPSYGSEVRGGTAHCFVKISSHPIMSPFIDQPDIAIILNQPSLDKFEKRINKKCLLILNSDLISRFSSSYAEKNTISLPLNELAKECGNIRVANTVALGVLVNLRPDIISRQTVETILAGLFTDSRLNQQNLNAFEKGLTQKRKNLL
jgi:2-oxoglutarate ferredoxin oxidoreductase subunit gamma